MALRRWTAASRRSLSLSLSVRGELNKSTEKSVSSIERISRCGVIPSRSLRRKHPSLGLVLENKATPILACCKALVVKYCGVFSSKFVGTHYTAERKVVGIGSINCGSQENPPHL